MTSQSGLEVTYDRLLLATGVLGGWTTYSSMIAGSLNLDHRGHPGWTLATLAVSLVANVGAAAAGLASGRILVRAAGS